MEAIENRFLVTTARCVVEGALRRTESRGAHYRDDFPEPRDDPPGSRHLLVRRGPAGWSWTSAPVDLSACARSEAR